MSFEIKILHQTNKNILVTLKVTAFFHFSLERSLVRSRISVGKPWYAAKTHMLGKLLWQHVTQNNYRFSFLSKDISNLLHFTHVYWVWWNATLTLCILLFDTAYWSFGLYHILMRISCIFSSWNSPAYIWSHWTDVNSDQNPLNTFQILEEVLGSLFTIFKGKNIFKSLQSHRRQGMMHEVCSGNSVVWFAVVWWWQMSLLCVFFFKMTVLALTACILTYLHYLWVKNNLQASRKQQTISLAWTELFICMLFSQWFSKIQVYKCSNMP